MSYSQHDKYCNDLQEAYSNFNCKSDFSPHYKYDTTPVCGNLVESLIKHCKINPLGSAKYMITTKDSGKK